jgi:hypothetical protein
MNDPKRIALLSDPRVTDAIRRTVETAPPFSDKQRALLGRLIRQHSSEAIDYIEVGDAA